MRGTPPSRPLGNAYWWIAQEDAAYLQYNYGCVAYVVRINGRLTTIIRWQGRTHEARCGSVAQGMRWIERWIEKRSGFPAKRPERWYDRVQQKRASQHPIHAYPLDSTGAELTVSGRAKRPAFPDESTASR